MRLTMRLFLFVLLLGLAMPGSADLTFDAGTIRRIGVRPGLLDVATPVHVEVSISGCTGVSSQPGVLSIEGTQIRFGVVISDACAPLLEDRTQTYLIGLLSAGVYDITYLACSGFPPPGSEPCVEIGSETLQVRSIPSGRALSVPAGSMLGWLVLCVAATLAGRRTLGSQP